MEQYEGEERRGFHLERSVSVGHILTTATIFIAGLAWVSNVDKHLAVTDTQIAGLEEADRRQTREAESSKLQIMQQLQNINDKLDRYVEFRTREK